MQGFLVLPYLETLPALEVPPVGLAPPAGSINERRATGSLEVTLLEHVGGERILWAHPRLTGRFWRFRGGG